MQSARASSRPRCSTSIVLASRTPNRPIGRSWGFIRWDASARRKMSRALLSILLPMIQNGSPVLRWLSMGGCSHSSAMIRPRTAKLYEQITPQIARDIVSRRLPPGAPIPSEPQLVATFGVSKTVARETVQVLEAAGLVRVQHGRRTVVLDEQEWNILSPLIQEAYRTENLAGPLIGELYEVRLQLEPQAAHWAAERATPLEVQQIGDILEAMRQSLSAKHPFLTHDQEFHIAVVQA